MYHRRETENSVRQSAAEMRTQFNTGATSTMGNYSLIRSYLYSYNLHALQIS